MKSNHDGGLRQVKRRSSGKSRALAKWEKQETRLLEWRRATEQSESMHGPEWVTGQLRHIDDLLDRHRKHKPSR